MSSKAEILQSWKFKQENVSLPSGVTVLLREFSGSDRDAFEQSMIKIVDDKRVPDLTNMRAKMVAMCAIDEETGEKMFTVDELAAAPAAFLEPLFDAAQRMNGAAPAAVEDAAKNSAAAPSGASTSA